jgi:hypothetical protein
MLDPYLTREYKIWQNSVQNNRPNIKKKLQQQNKNLTFKPVPAQAIPNAIAAP